MRTYVEIGRVSFKTNLTYKADYIIGLINNVLSISVAVAIWKAIYGGHPVNEIELPGLITYIVLVVLLQTTFVMDDFYLEKKIRTGEITTDLLRPANLVLLIFSYMSGTSLFKLLVQFFPSLLLTLLFFDLLPPSSFITGLFFVVSMILGYLVLYSLNFVFWVFSFWFYMSWSVITIKDAFIFLFSGVAFPIWFMPEMLQSILSYTPFDSIFYAPLSIYLGRLSLAAMLMKLLKQFIWAVILYFIGNVLWRRGIRRLVIQGG